MRDNGSSVDSTTKVIRLCGVLNKIGGITEITGYGRNIACLNIAELRILVYANNPMLL